MERNYGAIRNNIFFLWKKSNIVLYGKKQYSFAWKETI